MSADRFARHRALAGFGDAAQERVRTGRVLVVGLGGLGSPAARYLAAAGVGHLGLVDFGRVDHPDLQRQILYGAGDVGHGKAATAAARLHEAHPDVDVAPLDAPFEPSMVAGYDVVVDGTDDPGTRLLVHQTCVRAATTLVWGALEAWTAQWTTVTPGGPCLDCLFLQRGDPPQCSDVGVFGPLAGATGAAMAGEALKALAGMRTASGCLLVLDGRQWALEEVRFVRRPGCRTCSGATK